MSEPLERQLQTLRENLARLESVQDTRTAQFERQLRLASDYAKPSIQVEYDTWKTKIEKEISQASLLVSTVEKQIKEQAKRASDQARADLARMKAEALQKWTSDGGTPESFAAIWPDMERDILKQRTMGAIRASDPVQRKRDQIGGL